MCTLRAQLHSYRVQLTLLPLCMLCASRLPAMAVVRVRTPDGTAVICMLEFDDQARNVRLERRSRASLWVR
jgi:hypothetical protein